MASKLVILGFNNVLFDPIRGLWEGARTALSELFLEQIPVVLWSSLTRAEAVYYRAQFGLRDPFVVENGAALFVPLGYFDFDVSAQQTGGYEFWKFGLSTSELLTEIEPEFQRKSMPLRLIGDFTAEELGQLYALPSHLADLKQQREFSLGVTTAPYHEEVWQMEFSEIARRKDCHLYFDGVFHFFQKRVAPARTFETLVRFFEQETGRRPVVTALGGSEQDVDFLRLADVPIWLENDRPVSGSSSPFPKIVRPAGKGPAAWREVVTEILNHSRVNGNEA